MPRPIYGNRRRRTYALQAPLNYTGTPPPSAVIHRRSPSSVPTPVFTGVKLGDAIEKALSVVGITKDRVASWLGGCGGCSVRQEKLNQLDLWARGVLKGGVLKAGEYLARIIGQKQDVEGREMLVKTWAIGVTTVPQRRKDLLPRTLTSMKQAGFTDPWLFVDGELDTLSYPNEFQLNTVCRFPKILTAGHWVLSLYELYIRHPAMERYMIVQDDVVFCKNVRPYLDRLPDLLSGKKTYLNLYAAPSNEAQVLQGKPPGFHPSTQLGKGALALVFDREGVQTLLATRSLSNRPAAAHLATFAIDGGIQEALVVQNGYKELVHWPSLCQHMGHSRFGGQTQMPWVPNKQYHLPSNSFPGEQFDCLSLLTRQP